MVFAVFAALVAVPLFGQMRGGARGGSAMGRSGFAGHAPVAARGSGFVPAVRGGVRFNTFGGFGTFRGTGFSRGRFHHHHDRFFFGAGFYYPGYYWPYYYPYYGYSYPEVSYSYPSYEYSSDSSYQLEMARELDRLTYEVERLREEEESRAYPNAGGAAQKPESRQEPGKPTVLVFRDKHIQEVENYAIVGETLWLFNEKRATKLPLAELDLPATAKLNEERGIEFRVPAR